MKSLQSLSYKTLFTILFFSLAGIVFFIKIGGKTQKVSAAWWDETWKYRKSITVNNTGGNQSNVYLTVSIDTSDTTKFQIDCGDIRFTDQTNNLLDYYIISGCQTSSTTIHINFPTLIPNSSTLYLYYSNSSADNGFSTSDFSTPALSSTPTTNSEEISPAPIAYWKFDEGVGTTIFDSTGNFNGTLTGDTIPTWQIEDQCVSGKCLNIPTTGSVNIGNPSGFKINNNAITIETWVKFNYLDYSTNTGKLIGFAGKGSPDTAPGTPSSGFWFSYDNRNNRNSFTYTCFGNSAGGWSGGSNNFDGPNYNYTFTQNTWYHLAVTISDSQGRLYINGKQIGPTKTFSGLQLNNTTNNLYLGNLQGSYSTVGNQDEIKIYPYARTADQIKQDYNSRGSINSSSANLGIRSNTSPSIKSKLVAHWKLDESNGSTIKDSSGHNFLGTFGTGNSSPTWSTNGRFNQALSFDGNDSITLSNEIVSTSSIRTNGITYSAWIKPTTVSGVQKIFGQKPSSGYSDLASGGLDINTGKARMVAYDDNIAYKYATGNTTLIANQWYLITGVYNPSDQKIKIYVNGQFDGGETSITTFNRLNSNDYNLVGSHNNSSSFFNGLIDEIKIYNYALTPEEIKQDYNAGSAIQFGQTTQNIGGTTTSLDYCIIGDTSYCAAPVAEWNFEENTGLTIKDTSGNNYNGTLNSGNSSPTWDIGKNNKGSGINFDGNDFIDLGDTVASNKLSNLYSATYSFWIYPKSLMSSNNQAQRLIEKRDSTISSSIETTGYISSTFWYQTSPTFISDYWNSSKKLGFYDSGIDEWTSSNLNKWYYITIVFDSPNNRGKTYINGKLDKEYSLVNNAGMPTGNTNQTLATQLGRYRWNTTNFFQGKIDDVKIYNYARTPAQVAYDYNRGGPIGWWKFDECQGSVVNDSSGNNNTGTITIGSNGIQNSIGTCQIGTSAAWTNGANGKINASLNFDGTDDYISAGNSTIYNFTDSFTISSWIKLNSLNRYHGIVGKTASIWSDVTYSTRVGSDNQYSFVTYGTSQDDLSGGAADLNWHHLVFWFSKPTKRIYVDGIKVAEKTWNQSIRTNTQNLSLGAYAWGSGLSYLLNGRLDDLRIFNYGLTEEQIKQVYNNGAVNFQ